MSLPHRATPATINKVFERMQSDLRRPLTEEEKQTIVQRISSGEADVSKFMRDTELDADELGGGKNVGNWFSGYEDRLDGQNGRKTHLDFIQDRIAAHEQMLGTYLTGDEASNVRLAHQDQSKKLTMGIGARSAGAVDEWTEGQRSMTDENSSRWQRIVEKGVQKAADVAKDWSTEGIDHNGLTVDNMKKAFVKGAIVGATVGAAAPGLTASVGGGTLRLMVGAKNAFSGAAAAGAVGTTASATAAGTAAVTGSAAVGATQAAGILSRVGAAGRYLASATAKGVNVGGGKFFGNGLFRFGARYVAPVPLIAAAAKGTAVGAGQEAVEAVRENAPKAARSVADHASKFLNGTTIDDPSSPLHSLHGILNIAENTQGLRDQLNNFNKYAENANVLGNPLALVGLILYFLGFKTADITKSLGDSEIGRSIAQIFGISEQAEQAFNNFFKTEEQLRVEGETPQTLTDDQPSETKSENETNERILPDGRKVNVVNDPEKTKEFHENANKQADEPTAETAEKRKGASLGA